MSWASIVKSNSAPAVSAVTIHTPDPKPTPERVAALGAEITMLELKWVPMAARIRAYEAYKRAENERRCRAATTESAQFETKLYAVLWEAEHADEMLRVKRFLNDAERELQAKRAEMKALVSKV